MTLEILTLITMLCNVTALEDKKSNWTELKYVENYQKKCRVYYLDCYKKQEKMYRTASEKMHICIIERKP